MSSKTIQMSFRAKYKLWQPLSEIARIALFIQAQVSVALQGLLITRPRPRIQKQEAKIFPLTGCRLSQPLHTTWSPKCKEKAWSSIGCSKTMTAWPRNQAFLWGNSTKSMDLGSTRRIQSCWWTTASIQRITKCLRSGRKRLMSAWLSALPCAEWDQMESLRLHACGEDWWL